MDEAEQEQAKRRAGESAANAVPDDAVVGLGTGSTAAYAIDRLGERVAGGLDLRGIPTSHQARRRAQTAGIPLTTLDEHTPEVAIDGADQVADGALLKGGGAAHVREKVVAAAADRLVIVVDLTKLREQLAGRVPVAVVPAARRPVADAVSVTGGEPTLRQAAHKDGPVVTDDGALVVDCLFDPIHNPGALATDLDTIPGVIGHGLFVGLADEIRVGTPTDLRVQQL